MAIPRLARKVLRITGYILYLFFVTFIALEVILRIYNPFPSRIKGDHIILPANQTHHFKNDVVPGLDREINIQYNSLGLRGPEQPTNYDSCLSILTVGGSTTFGWYLSTEKTWPYLLSQEVSKTFKNVWLNNAGMPGQSTYGHIIMMRDHLIRLKPKVIIFMTGINDVGRSDIGPYDSAHVHSFKDYILTYSETANLVVAMLRSKRAIERRLGNVNVDFRHYDTLNISEDEIVANLTAQKPYVANYRQRLEIIMDHCIANNIYPILMTQPLICGRVIDSTTGADLGKIKIKYDLNGELWSRRLELYNQVVKDIAVEYNVPYIDLARMLPKNSLYYFDYMHQTNEGTKKITELIIPYVNDFLGKRFPGYLKEQQKN